MARTTTFEGTDGATLTVSIVEDLTINSRDYGSKQTVAIPNIVDVTRRIITVLHGTESVIATFASVVGPGGYVAADVMYIRFSNLDDTNFVIIRFQEDGQDQYNIRLSAGETWTGYSAGFEAERVAGNIGNYAALRATADSISAVAGGDAVDVEVFIASKTDAQENYQNETK